MWSYQKFFIRSIALCCTSLISFTFNSHAQDYSKPPVDEVEKSFNMGIGFGIDYGGIGMRVAYLPEKHVTIFGGAGYNLNDFGYNIGVGHRVNPLNKACFYYDLMYGYNAVIIIENATEFNKTYYGISMGAGVELHSRRRPANFWNLEIIIPFRSQEFDDDINAIKNNPYINLKSEPLPVAFSFGYHFRLN